MIVHFWYVYGIDVVPSFSVYNIVNLREPRGEATCTNYLYQCRSYSYYIQVSLDRNNWVTVVQRSSYLCRSWQELFFPTTVARYIRVIGVQNTMNRSFHLVSLACLYSTKPYQLSDNGLISKPIG